MTFVNIKFYLLYTALLLFVICHIIFCEDWTHSGKDNDDEKDENGKSRERQEVKNFQVPGIFLPWVKTSRQHLSSIPKSLLVQINKNLHTDLFFETPFFCRVEVVKRMKIIGKVSAPETDNVYFPKNNPQKIKSFLKSVFCHFVNHPHTAWLQQTAVHHSRQVPSFAERADANY